MKVSLKKSNEQVNQQKSRSFQSGFCMISKLMNQSILNNSTWKMSVAFGGITPPAPCDP